MLYFLLMLKYFIIIKKKKIVAPRIDFDDYKVFEGITNEFSLKKDFLYFRCKIIILSNFDLRIFRASIEDF